MRRNSLRNWWYGVVNSNTTKRLIIGLFWFAAGFSLGLMVQDRTVPKKLLNLVLVAVIFGGMTGAAVCSAKLLKQRDNATAKYFGIFCGAVSIAEFGLFLAEQKNPPGIHTSLWWAWFWISSLMLLNITLLLVYLNISGILENGHRRKPQDSPRS